MMHGFTDKEDDVIQLIRDAGSGSSNDICMMTG